MFFLRRLIKRIIVVLVLGYIVRRLLESSDPRAQRVGRVANRLMGNRFASATRGRTVARA